MKDFPYFLLRRVSLSGPSLASLGRGDRWRLFGANATWRKQKSATEAALYGYEF